MKAHRYCYGCSKFHDAIMYYGWINFDYDVIEEVENEQLNDREKYWINYYKSDTEEKGYNSITGDKTWMMEAKLIQKENNYHNVSLPFGYEHRNKDGKVYINENDGNIIKDIFMSYIKGQTIRELKKSYNKNTPYQILRNIKYTGNEIFPQIIEKDIFDKVQVLLKNRRYRQEKECIIDGVKYKSRKDAAKLLGVHYVTISNYIKNGISKSSPFYMINQNNKKERDISD